MKRLLGLLLASTLVLGACGSNDGDKKEESKKTHTIKNYLMKTNRWMTTSKNIRRFAKDMSDSSIKRPMLTF